MKSTIFKSLIFSSLLAVAVGCGKDGGGGSSNGGVGMNPVIDPNLNQNGQQALANLKAWYANTNESTGLMHRGFYRKETVSYSGGFQFTGSLCIGSWGINCGSQTTQPTNCYVRSGDGVNYDTGTPASNGVTCNVTQSQVTKASNADLTRAVNGNGMILLSVQQQGNTYQLIYGVSNGYQVVPKAAYTIDTNYHSLLNPIIIEENNSRTVVKNLQVFQF